MLKFRVLQQFSKFKADLLDFKNHSYGPLQEQDMRQLRVNKQTPLKQVYFSYMKHMQLYEQQQQENKLQAIRDAYVRVLSFRLQSLENLSEEELKDLRFLQDNNYGFPFVEGLRRSEIITQFQEEIESKSISNYPRLCIMMVWLIFGLPSMLISDQYQHV